MYTAKPNQINSQNKIDKTEEVFRVVSEVKRNKLKCKMVIHFDGSGNLAKAELTQDI